MSSATEYLDQLAQAHMRVPRETPRDGLQQLLAAVGQPGRTLRCVHIAGSKGKGSTALMLDAMLRAGGCRTGVFTSPHVERWNERIRVDGVPVCDTQLDALLAELQPHVTRLRPQCQRGPDFFEVLLVAALCLFERLAVDVVIVEAGVGARFDATTVVRPAVSVLTTVELEHTHSLGPDLASIAADKAYVARPGVPLVIGPLPPSAHAVVQAWAATVGAPLLQPRARLTGDGRAELDGGFMLALPAPSQAQADCAAIAFACVRALELFAVQQDAARAGMVGLVLPGRLEVLGHAPLVVADSAHTSASMAALIAALRAWGLAQSPLQLVLSCSGQRDLATLAAPLLVQAKRVYITRADAGRSTDPQPLAAAVRLHCADGVGVQVIEAPAAALAAARAQAPANGIICATGSVYMAGAARQFYSRDRFA